jgi:hypothetical protein
MKSRMNLLSAVRCNATTSRFLSSTTARRRIASPSALALVIEDLLAHVADLDHRLALVVLQHDLARQRCDPELEQPRTGFSGGSRTLTVTGLPSLGSEPAPTRRCGFVFHVDRDRLACEAAVGHHDVDEEQRDS